MATQQEIPVFELCIALNDLIKESKKENGLDNYIDGLNDILGLLVKYLSDEEFERFTLTTLNLGGK